MTVKDTGVIFGIIVRKTEIGKNAAGIGIIALEIVVEVIIVVVALHNGVIDPRVADIYPGIGRRVSRPHGKKVVIILALPVAILYRIDITDIVFVIAAGIKHFTQGKHGCRFEQGRRTLYRRGVHVGTDGIVFIVGVACFDIAGYQHIKRIGKHSEAKRDQQTAKQKRR